MSDYKKQNSSAFWCINCRHYRNGRYPAQPKCLKTGERKLINDSCERWERKE